MFIVIVLSSTSTFSAQVSLHGCFNMQIDEIRNCLFAGSPPHKFLSQTIKIHHLFVGLSGREALGVAQFFYCWKLFVCKYFYASDHFFFERQRERTEKSFEKTLFFIATKTINFQHLKFPEAGRRERNAVLLRWKIIQLMVHYS